MPSSRVVVVDVVAVVVVDVVDVGVLLLITPFFVYFWPLLLWSLYLLFWLLSREFVIVGCFISSLSLVVGVK